MRAEKAFNKCCFAAPPGVTRARRGAGYVKTLDFSTSFSPSSSMADLSILVLVGAITVLLAYQSLKAAPPGPSREPSPEPKRTARDDYLEVLAARVAALENRVQDLPGLWEEERKRAERHRARAEEAERRTRELVESDESDDWDEVEQGPHLRSEHAESREAEAMQPVRGGVAGSRAADVRAKANRILGLG